MLGLAFGALPLPYKLLAAVTLGASVYIGGYLAGHRAADQSALVASLQRDKSDFTAKIADAEKAVQSRDAVVQKLTTVSQAALQRADAADKQGEELRQQLNAYTSALAPSPNCNLSPADAHGLRAIGARKRGAGKPGTGASDHPSDTPQ